MIAALTLALAAAGPHVVLTVPAKHRLIEGIATDGQTIWLSSVVDRRILAWRKGGRLRVIAMPPGTPRPLGLAWDAHRGWLWIAGDCPELAATGPCEEGALVAIDRVGRLRARLTVPGGAHFGDVSVDAAGVLVSDSRTGAVYRCTGACTALTPVIPVGVGKSAQSSVRYGDGKLLVADYSRGIVSVAADGKVTPIPREDGRPLRGVDGLVRAGDWFVGVQNSQSPGVVFAFKLAADGAHLTELRGLANGADLPEPTQIAVDGDRILIVADAQWSAYDAAAKAPLPAQHPTRILAIPAPR